MDKFVKTILEYLQQRLGNEYTILVEKVTKNNGVVLTGIIAKKQGLSAYPTIYIDRFLKEDISQAEMERIIDQLYQKIHEAEMEEEPDLSNFMDYEKAKESIAFKLVHAEKNKEYLKKVPHRRFHDLALVYYYTVMEKPFCGNAVIVIKKEHMKRWQVTEELLYETALRNMPIIFPPVIRNIEDVMRELLESGLKEDLIHFRNDTEGETIFSDEWVKELLEQMTGSFQIEGEKIPMYVLTNRKKLLGAACILYPKVLKQFGDKLKQDFYVLPSSIHEVILVPTIPATEPEMLRDIVSDINRTQVAVDEVLADSVYFYSRKRDSLEWIC